MEAAAIRMTARPFRPCCGPGSPCWSRAAPTERAGNRGQDHDDRHDQVAGRDHDPVGLGRPQDRLGDLRGDDLAGVFQARRDVIEIGARVARKIFGHQTVQQRRCRDLWPRGALRPDQTGTSLRRSRFRDHLGNGVVDVKRLRQQPGNQDQEGRNRGLHRHVRTVIGRKRMQRRMSPPALAKARARPTTYPTAAMASTIKMSQNKDMWSPEE